MGCDIHSVLQIKKSGIWEIVKARPGGDHRDYDSFAVMADVRNGYGFAGVSTGEGWPFITKPRGFPEDFEKLLNDDRELPVPKWQYNFQKDTDEFEDALWMGDHSFSWLLLSEIEEFLEKKIIGRQYTSHGVVDWDEYVRMKEESTTKPKRWCGGVGGPSVVVITKAAADSGAVGSHVQMSWQTDAISELRTLQKYLKEMRAVLMQTAGATSDDVRLVFGFDN